MLQRLWLSIGIYVIQPGIEAPILQPWLLSMRNPIQLLDLKGYIIFFNANRLGN